MNGGQPVVEVEAPDTRVDGRTARSTKTRDAIADALLDLLTDGKLRPTAREIADRAAVSVRSVYVHFDDLEDLFCIAAQRHHARLAPLLAPIPATGTLAERAEAVVQQRIRLYAASGAVSHATRLHAEFSPTLARTMRDARSRSRADLERVFAADLEARGTEERASTIAMLDVVTGPETWQALREFHNLDIDVAQQCIIDAIVLQLRTVDA